MVRLTDCHDITIAFDWDVEPQTKQILSLFREYKYDLIFIIENIHDDVKK